MMGTVDNKDCEPEAQFLFALETVLHTFKAVPDDLTRWTKSDIIMQDMIKNSNLEGVFGYESRKELWIKP
jgi:hypothetical protein